jgi:large subunit ribosomal protein L10
LAITRERKEELIAHYSQLLTATDGFLVAEYRGLSVAKLNDLRARLTEAAGSFSVAKNTLFSIALTQSGWPVPEDLLVGPTGIAFGNGNLPKVAKTIQGFAKDNPDLFVIKGGVMAGSVFSAAEVEAVANLPTMEEIRAQLAGLVVQPAAQLAGLLNAATSQVVNVLQAYLQENGGGEEAAA